MEILIKTVLDHKIDTRLICLVTDDTNAISLVNDGNMDYLAREAMKCGVDFMTAMQMVTINTAHSFHMERKIGNLAPGRFGRHPTPIRRHRELSGHENDLKRVES